MDSEYSIYWNIFIDACYITIYLSQFKISKLILEEIHPYKHDKTVKSM